MSDKKPRKKQQEEQETRPIKHEKELTSAAHLSREVSAWRLNSIYFFFYELLLQ